MYIETNDKRSAYFMQWGPLDRNYIYITNISRYIQYFTPCMCDRIRCNQFENQNTPSRRARV